MRPKYNYRNYKHFKDSRQGKTLDLGHRDICWTLHKSLRQQSKKITKWDYLKLRSILYSKGKK